MNLNGSLDTTFSGDGKQITDFGGDDFSSSVALQTDGRIIVAGSKNTATLGYFALARYNPGGSLDTTFAGTGKKVFGLVPNMNSGAGDVLIQSDGKIVAMGRAYNGTDDDFALVRLKSGGAFDTSFSGDGKVTVNFGGDDRGNALTLQPSDGKYVLVGHTNDGAQTDFALARVLP